MELCCNDPELELLLKTARIRYINTDAIAGISRHRSAKNFFYKDSNQKRITDPLILKRIAGLVLPPAWEQVWISPYANSHLQATGYDARGRKQYRYHPEWVKLRGESKFSLLLSFGEKLPDLRKQLSRDIKTKSLNRNKVCALATSVMIETSIRVGNLSYEKSNGSYGLTTLKRKHISFKGSGAFFKFKGKKGIIQEIGLKKPQLARLLNKINELPGQTLFQYYDETGILSQLRSEDLNDYIRNVMGEQMSCKVVRTWSGCIYFLTSLAAAEPFTSETECKRNIATAIDEVAQKLGNTRAVCKNYYIHPGLITYYQNNKLYLYLSALRPVEGEEEKLKKAEKALIRFLKKYSD